MTPMRAISVTICRDRQPDSAIAPLQPLPADEWKRFADGVLAAIERHVPSEEDTEQRRGHTVWDGREEECETLSRIWVNPTPEQLEQLRAELAVLAANADQKAVVLHDEWRHLVTAAKMWVLSADMGVEDLTAALVGAPEGVLVEDEGGGIVSVTAPHPSQDAPEWLARTSLHLAARAVSHALAPR